jgi:hypothetical protein
MKMTTQVKTMLIARAPLSRILPHPNGLLRDFKLDLPHDRASGDAARGTNSLRTTSRAAIFCRRGRDDPCFAPEKRAKSEFWAKMCQRIEQRKFSSSERIFRRLSEFVIAGSEFI